MFAQEVKFQLVLARHLHAAYLTRDHFARVQRVEVSLSSVELFEEL